MTTKTPFLRLLTVVTLLAGTALVAGCSSPAPITRTTTTEQTSTVTPPPVVSSTTTTTVQQSRP